MEVGKALYLSYILFSTICRSHFHVLICLNLLLLLFLPLFGQLQFKTTLIVFFRLFRPFIKPENFFPRLWLVNHWLAISPDHRLKRSRLNHHQHWHQQILCSSAKSSLLPPFLPLLHVFCYPLNMIGSHPPVLGRTTHYIVVD